VNQTPSTLQTLLLKSKETQTINPPKDTSHHSLQIFLLDSISNFNLSFLQTLTLMACLRTITHMEHFILVFHMKPTLASPPMECLEKELQLKVLRLHHQLSPWLLAKVLSGQVQLHLYLLHHKSGPTSLISPAPQINEDMSNQERSDASDDEEKKAGRMNWSEEEDLKLVNAWLHHSIDSVKGNSQKDKNFWKNIIDMGGHSGYPKILGRVFQVLRISGFQNCYPKFA